MHLTIGETKKKKATTFIFPHSIKELWNELSHCSWQSSWSKSSGTLHLQEVKRWDGANAPVTSNKKKHLGSIECASNMAFKCGFNNKTEAYDCFCGSFVFCFLGHTFSMWVCQHTNPSWSHYHWWASGARSQQSCGDSLWCTSCRGWCVCRHPRSTCPSWQPLTGPPIHKVWNALDWTKENINK